MIPSGQYDCRVSEWEHRECAGKSGVMKIMPDDVRHEVVMVKMADYYIGQEKMMGRRLLLLWLPFILGSIIAFFVMKGGWPPESFFVAFTGTLMIMAFGFYRQIKYLTSLECPHCLESGSLLDVGSRDFQGVRRRSVRCKRCGEISPTDIQGGYYANEPTKKIQ